MSNTENETPRWVSPEGAADYLGVKVLTIRRYLDEGLLTGHRLGNRLIRLDLNAIDAVLRAGAERRVTQ
jgi:DNA binding domain, excisionase family